MECDICLSINAPENSHAFGTKIFDYMALNKNIWHISNGGELFDLLEKTDQYVSTYEEESVLRTIEMIENDKIKQVNKYKNFSIEKTTQDLLTLLQ